MKKTKKIIGSLISLIFLFNLSPPLAFAQSAAEKACDEKLLPNYEDVDKNWQEADKKNLGAYEKTFEAAQEAYHSYIACLFEFAEKRISEKNNRARDWLIPKQICLESTELSNAIAETAPDQMLEPILSAHKEYADYLNKLFTAYENSNPKDEEESDQRIGIYQLLSSSASLDSMKRKKQMEVDSAMVAIDLMFTRLKEFRLAFVMHVQFQCMLDSLEKYRRALGEMRRVVVPLPEQLRDASVTK